MRESLLFIDGCARGKESRTLRLCEHLFERMREKSEIEITKERLANSGMLPLSALRLEQRERKIAENDFDDGFDMAKRFSKADIICFGMPYWDLSFPSLVKVYIENICVRELTFRYDESGAPVSLCRAKTLICVTTAGGFIGKYDFGREYIEGLCGALFGIKNTTAFAAEGLDIAGADVNGILFEAEKSIDRWAEEYYAGGRQ